MALFRSYVGAPQLSYTARGIVYNHVVYHVKLVLGGPMHHNTFCVENSLKNRI